MRRSSFGPPGVKCIKMAKNFSGRNEERANGGWHVCVFSSRRALAAKRGISRKISASRCSLTSGGTNFFGMWLPWRDVRKIRLCLAHQWKGGWGGKTRFCRIFATVCVELWNLGVIVRVGCAGMTDENICFLCEFKSVNSVILLAIVLEQDQSAQKSIDN